nr:hypothetical protein GCM10020093_078640 [Planobispora longispora]
MWNRTASKADALVAQGAARALTAADAIAASPLVIACVIDYDAVHTIVEPAADALKGRTLVNLTADSPERARRTAAWADDHGIGYLDGAIMSPTETIGVPRPSSCTAARRTSTASTGRRWRAWAAPPPTSAPTRAGRPRTTWPCSTCSGRP